ncbi:MAG TPA: hypothetical protein VFZ01_19020, partial [Geminicoccaceae bacterium]
DLARTQIVLGFAELVRIDTEDALQAFERAIVLDQADPLPHLGRGLALIRDSDLEAGRRELEIAVGLDPEDAVIRSYLGKAFFEERRDELAGDQLRIAKRLDPNDPTPWFYDAIRKQLLNRPVEALRDLETAIDLNDNRAVYRSSFLLDGDLAARGARLGRIYGDLGFQQLALVEGWKSLAEDPGNFSAHRLLADTYSTLPLHQIAQDSELLQAQLLQPLNLEPVQPRLAANRLDLLGETGLSGIGLNEYSRLFVADGAELYAEGIVGTHDILGDNLILSALLDRFSLSLGQSHFETDGFRANNDLNEDIYDLFGQVQLTPDTSLLTEYRSRDADSGDLSLRFDVDNFGRMDRSATEQDVFRVGGRHSFAPNSTLIASYAFSEGEFTFDRPGFGVALDNEGHLVELRHIMNWPWLNLTGGAGVFDGEEDEVVSVGTFRFEAQRDTTHNNAYGYGQLDVWRDLVLTLGVSVDDFEGATADRTQVNPKAGLLWEITSTTTLRAAAFRALKRTLIASQTIEPTQVAGFNQFFDDPNGTESWRYGLGVDQELGSEAFVGAEVGRRDLAVPLFAGTEGFGSEFDVDETTARGYGYWTPFDWLALSLEYRYERREDEDAATGPGLESTTHTVPLEARFFHPSGVFAQARLTYVDQSGTFENLTTRELESGSDDFMVADAALGYRFPDRRGLVAIEARNLFDTEFDYQDTDFDRGDQTTLPERAILPELTVLGRLVVRF